MTTIFLLACQCISSEISPAVKLAYVGITLLLSLPPILALGFLARTAFLSEPTSSQPSDVVR